MQTRRTRFRLPMNVRRRYAPPTKKVQAAPKTFLDHVKKLLGEKSRKENGDYNTRLHDAADAYAKMMESGSFVHVKEFIDREEGKVPSRISDAEGKNLKLYIGMPIDDEPGAP